MALWTVLGWIEFVILEKLYSTTVQINIYKICICLRHSVISGAHPSLGSSEDDCGAGLWWVGSVSLFISECNCHCCCHTSHSKPILPSIQDNWLLNILHNYKWNTVIRRIWKWYFCKQLWPPSPNFVKTQRWKQRLCCLFMNKSYIRVNWFLVSERNYFRETWFGWWIWWIINRSSQYKCVCLIIQLILTVAK